MSEGTVDVSVESAGGAARLVGRPVRRVEDPRLLRGKGRFAADVAAHAPLFAAFVRSPVAAGVLRSVDLSPARSMPGVAGAFDAAGLGLPGVVAALEREDFRPTTMPLLAQGRCRFVGEPIAVVVADDPYRAEDAAEAVVVDLEPTPAVASIEAALAPSAPVVHEEVGTNVVLDARPFADAAVDALLGPQGASEGLVVVEARLASSRLSALPLETRGCRAEPDERRGQLVVVCSTQVPHLVRTQVARSLGLSESAVRVLTGDVGGGFGQKCVVGREEVVVAALARRLGAAVAWVEDRRENLIASFAGHEQRYSVRAAFRPSGEIVALDALVETDVGAYSPFPFTYGVEALMAAGELPGVYRVPRYQVRARAITTNKAPTAPYRGVSRPQLVAVMEQLMENAARQLHLDPVELRRRNLITTFPWTGPNRITYDAGSYTETLLRCQDAIARRGWYERRAESRSLGGPRQIGIGLACFNERTGYGSATFAERHMPITPGFERVRIRMDGSGTVTVATGISSHGQGHETTIAQVVADRLGVALSSVRVSQGDTDLSPHGFGTFASRSMVIGGGAAWRAADALASRLVRLGAHLMEVDPADVELLDGAVVVRGQPNRTLALSEIARVAHEEASRLPDGDDGVLELLSTFDPPGSGTFSNATHAALVEVDTETGATRVLDYVVVEDCGVVVNPLVVEGQVRGGVAQGIGAALIERLVFADDGQPATTTLLDYLAPSATEVPDIAVEHVETPSATNPIGAKGMGEGGLIGAPAAVLGALGDVLGRAVEELPARPEVVLRTKEAR